MKHLPTRMRESKRPLFFWLICMGCAGKSAKFLIHLLIILTKEFSHVIENRQNKNSEFGIESHLDGVFYELIFVAQM